MTQKILHDLLALNSNQRHDFINHLQVIWGFVKIDKGDRAIQYIEQVVEFLQGLKVLNQIKQPEIALAFFLNLSQLGMNDNVSFSVDKDWYVPEERLSIVYDVLKNIWDIIREPLAQDKLSIEFNLIQSKIIIKANYIDDAYIFIWPSILKCIEASHLIYIHKDNEIIINFN